MVTRVTKAVEEDVEMVEATEEGAGAMIKEEEGAGAMIPEGEVVADMVREAPEVEVVTTNKITLLFTSTKTAVPMTIGKEDWTMMGVVGEAEGRNASSLKTHLERARTRTRTALTLWVPPRDRLRVTAMFCKKSSLHKYLLPYHLII